MYCQHPCCFKFSVVWTSPQSCVEAVFFFLRAAVGAGLYKAFFRATLLYSLFPRVERVSCERDAAQAVAGCGRFFCGCRLVTVLACVVPWVSSLSFPCLIAFLVPCLFAFLVPSLFAFLYASLDVVCCLANLFLHYFSLLCTIGLPAGETARHGGEVFHTRWLSCVFIVV